MSKKYSRQCFGVDSIFPKSKRSQHEIVGFVLIVLLVSVVGVIFLAITLGSPEPERQNSVEVSHLLEASMYHTTNCAVNFIPQYRSMQDLIKECYKDRSGNPRNCLDGNDVCEQLQIDLQAVLSESLNVGEDGVNRGYNIDIYFTSDDKEDPNDLILQFDEGTFIECSSVVGGGHPIPVSSFGFGRIETELKVCKN
jgi:hypothetical protein